MKIRNIIFGIFLVLLSCDNSNIPDNTELTEYSGIQGYVAKGPMQTGSDITISELDENYIATGLTYNTTTLNKYGEYEIATINLANNVVEMKCDGYYYNESTGEISDSRIILYGIEQIENNLFIGINVISTVIKNRVKILINNNKSFNDAKEEAITELLSAFNLEYDENTDLGIFEKSSNLIYLSSLFTYGRSPSEISELLTELAEDMKDGVIEEDKKEEILFKAINMDIYVIRQNLEKFYNETIPDLSTAHNKFLSLMGYSDNEIYYFNNSEITINQTDSYYLDDGKYYLGIGLGNNATIKIELENREQLQGYFVFPDSEMHYGIALTNTRIGISNDSDVTIQESEERITWEWASENEGTLPSAPSIDNYGEVLNETTKQFIEEGIDIPIYENYIPYWNEEGYFKYKTIYTISDGGKYDIILYVEKFQKDNPMVMKIYENGSSEVTYSLTVITN